MLTFIVRRLLLAVPVLLGVVFVVMLTVDLLPGDAVTLMLGEHATKDAVAKLRDHLGLDKPFLVRYLDYVGRVFLHGDLGRSIQQNRPVAAELADAWPATVQLTAAALVLAAVLGIATGVASAVWPNSLFDAFARLGSLFGLSMPIFWTGLVLIVIFSLWLHWLPVGGAGARPPHGQSDLRPRLHPAAGRRAGLRAGVRRHQPAGRSLVRPARPARRASGLTR